MTFIYIFINYYYLLCNTLFIYSSYKYYMDYLLGNMNVHNQLSMTRIKDLSK